MTDEPVDLDTHRSMAGKMASEIRRHSLKDVEVARESLRRKQQELETQLLAEPARNWHEVAIKAQYLIRRFAQSAEAQDARRQKLINCALSDIDRLLELEETDR